MSIQASHMHQVSNRDFRFSRPVGLRVQEGWIFIESVEQAQSCLNEVFADNSGPSYLRAMATCVSALARQVPPDAAQANLIVAAMEAGFPFEILEHDGVALEREVDSAAAKALEDLFPAEAAE